MIAVCLVGAGVCVRDSHRSVYISMCIYIYIYIYIYISLLYISVAADDQLRVDLCGLPIYNYKNTPSSTTDLILQH